MTSVIMWLVVRSTEWVGDTQNLAMKVWSMIAGAALRALPLPIRRRILRVAVVKYWHRERKTAYAFGVYCRGKGLPGGADWREWQNAESNLRPLTAGLLQLGLEDEM